MSDAGTTLMVWGFVAVVILVLFLIGRSFVCWYFKMNEVVSLLKEIKTALQNNNPGKKGNQHTGLK